MAKRVIVVGGGYAGAAVARALDEAAEVRLIHARDRFVHNVAAIRAVVDPSLLDRILIPYDRLLRRGSARQSFVVGVSSRGVTLADGEQIEGDVVVVATGSHYATPFKPQGETTREFAENLRAAHSNLMTANAVAIVGGGAVGVELAGEISSAYPSKAVMLVSGSPSVMPGYSDKLADALAAQLRSKEVSLRFNRRVENLAARDRPFAGSPDEDLGGAHGQLIFPALGARPTTAVFNKCPGQASMRRVASR